MGVYKRGRVWYYRFVVDGEEYKASTERTNKREAEGVEAAERKKILDRKQLGYKEEVSLGDAVDRYLASIKKLNKADPKQQRDWKKQHQRAKKLFGSRWDRKSQEEVTRYGLKRSMLLHELQGSDISKLIDKRLDEGMKPRTINLEIALISRVVNVARDEWGVRVNPELSFKGKKFEVVNRNRRLSNEEEAAFLKEIDPERTGRGIPPKGTRHPDVERSLQDAYDCAVALLDTGGRYMEVCTLMWTQVFLNRGLLQIERAKTENEGLIGITERLMEVLTRRYASRTGPWVFMNADNDGPRPYHTARALKNAMDRAGINSPEKVAKYGSRSAHSLRDTFASKLTDNNVSLRRVQDLLGHSSPMMTQKYASPDQQSSALGAAKVLDGYKPRVTSDL